MGNTIEETEPNYATECATMIKNVHENASVSKSSFSLSKALQSVISNVPESMKEDISMESLLAELNSHNDTKRKVQRANGIKNQAGALNDLDEGPNVRYLKISHFHSDVPKVRLHDLVLNIQSKTGAEEVPPRRDE